QVQDARQASLRTEVRCRKGGRRSLPAGQQVGFIVHVEAEAHRHARIVRPAARPEFAPYARRRHRLPKLLLGPFRARLAASADLLGPHRPANTEHQPKPHHLPPPAARYTTRPPIIVIWHFNSRIASAGMLYRSRSHTARSASLPTSIDPM